MPSIPAPRTLRWRRHPHPPSWWNLTSGKLDYGYVTWAFGSPKTGQWLAVVMGGYETALVSTLAEGKRYVERGLRKLYRGQQCKRRRR